MGQLHTVPIIRIPMVFEIHFLDQGTHDEWGHFEYLSTQLNQHIFRSMRRPPTMNHPLLWEAQSQWTDLIPNPWLPWFHLGTISVGPGEWEKTTSHQNWSMDQMQPTSFVLLYHSNLGMPRRRSFKGLATGIVSGIWTWEPHKNKNFPMYFPHLKNVFSTDNESD